MLWKLKYVEMGKGKGDKGKVQGESVGEVGKDRFGEG